MSNEPSIPLALEATNVRWFFAQYFAEVEVRIEVLGIMESLAPGLPARSLLERPWAPAIFIWPEDGGLSKWARYRILLEVAKVCRTQGNPLGSP